MNLGNVMNLSTALIKQAETECENDPGMHQAAAMVYVGDVYALYAAADGAANQELTPHERDGLLPFIR